MLRVVLYARLPWSGNRGTEGADEPVEVEAADVAELDGRECVLAVLGVVSLLEVDEEPGDEDGGYPASQVLVSHYNPIFDFGGVQTYGSVRIVM